MVNLFDIMRNAQGGEGLNNLSRRFGLSFGDTQRAVEALLPAFSLAFQRNMHDPNAFARFIELLGSGRYAPFYDGGATASPEKAAAGWANGTEVLNRIMGSKDVSRRVAEQAAVATGIGVDVLQQMLPLVAATIMGGVFRQASLQGLGDLFARWAEAFHRAHAGQAQPAAPASWPQQAGNPFEIWMSLLAPTQSAGLANGGARIAQASAAPTSGSAPSNPVEAWAAMVDAMLGRKPPAPPAPPEPPAGTNPLQVLSQMFDAGTAMQTQYVAALQGIIDRFWQTDGGRPA
jgi:hypothetical protein